MVGENSNINFITGNNFSGRSDFLKQSCAAIMNSGNISVFIGEIPSNYLSGVSPTVLEELELFSKNSKKELIQACYKLLEKYGFDKLYENNPFTLSGGEQVILAIMIGLFCEPQLLAIDTLTEQLNKEWAEPLFNLINNNLQTSQIHIADNRKNEYNINYRVISPDIISTEHKYKFQKPQLKEIESKIHSEEIILKDLTFGYTRKVNVLQELSIHLLPGNIYILRGINGAGKSTLAKLLAGILKPQRGDISTNGNKANFYKFPGKVFGYSFQNPDEQLFSRTIEDEVLKFNKNETDFTSIRREEFIEMFGLNMIRKFHPAEMPFVIRKRLAIASTLAIDRPWYILDEPTIGQDAEFLDFLAVLFISMTSQGKGLIIISHSDYFIEKFKAKILYLDKGKLIFKQSK